MEVDIVSQKKRCKRDLVWSSSSASGKIIFVLLTEVIKFYIRHIAINARDLSLEFVPRLTF